MIVINADDFGMNERNSAAIAECFAKGLVTDTTMLANGEYFDEAVILAREQGFADKIGIHLNLTEGVPLTEKIRSCPRFVTDGCFNKQYDRRSRLTAEEKEAIYTELNAQIGKLQSAGIAITHADSHHHIHMAGQIAPIVVHVCREHGIKKIRIGRNLQRIGLLTRLERRYRSRRFKMHGFRTTANFGYIKDVTDGDLPDDTEILVHPDYDKDGQLIDRRGMRDGLPFGNPITDLRSLPDIRLGDYTIL